MNFWSIVGLFFWSFVFIAYLFVLFAIIGDLFRDHQLNGWLKALWIIFLVFVPFLTALVYLIARGNHMATRPAQHTAQVHADSDAYVHSITAAATAEKMSDAQNLLDTGGITQSEFDDIKERI